jgi:iron complex outermembrane receptor protein
MSKRSKLALCVASLAGTMLSAPAAIAQDSGPRALEALEEITVTARKRSENLQDIPMSVDVFTAERLDQLSIDNVEDMARFSSSLQFDEGVLPTDTRPVIRGVTSLRGRPNVGIMIDSVDASSESLTVAGGGITTNLALLDLERVEILKGPQNALYGRSAFTGVINYVTKRPGDTFESDIRIGYDAHAQSDLRYAIGGPLSDSLRARAIVAKYDSDGYYENPNTGGKLGASDTFGGALALEWDVTEKITTYFRAEHSSEEHTPRAEVHIASLSPVSDPSNFLMTGSVTDQAVMVPHDAFDTAVCNGIDRIQPYWDSFGMPGAQPCRPMIVGKLSADESMIDLSPDPRTGRDFTGTDIETTRFHGDISVGFDNGMELKYILGYLDNETDVQLDFDRTNHQIVSTMFPFPASQYGMSAMAEQHVETEQWSHELRLSGGGERVNWHLSALRWEENMDLLFDDEWYLREGGNPAAVLGVLNDTIFNYLQQPTAPPFTNGMCDAVYPGNPDCVPMVTHLQSSIGDTPALPITRETVHNSIAGMVTVNLTDTLAMTVEGRWLDEQIDYAGVVDDIAFSGQFGDDPWWGFMFRSGEMSYNTIADDAFIPKVTMDWSISDSVLAYGYYSKAFKPGGVATTDSNGDVTDGEYTAEKLDVYELGIKTEIREHSIRWNASAYLYDYTDQQVPFQFFSPTTGRFQTAIVNAGETEIKGFETELTWNSAFVDGLGIQLGYTFTDAEFTDFNLAEILAPAGAAPSSFNRAKAGNQDGDFTGKRPPMTAEHSATASVRYDMPVGDSMYAYVELFSQYQSERFVDEGNWAKLPAYTVHDFYTGLSGNKWGLTLYVQNLADDDTVRSGIGNVDFSLLPDGRSLSIAHQVYLPQPRTIGARLEVLFGD